MGRAPAQSPNPPVIYPATLASIDDLELAGKMLATGYLFGRHLGQRHGPGYEFAQYRAWQPGDSSRTVDWRLYARSQRLNVRESELETDQRLWIILDTSASMDFASPGGALNKFSYARTLAAALGYLAHQQGDELGLVSLGQCCRVQVPASAIFCSGDPKSTGAGRHLPFARSPAGPVPAAGERGLPELR